MFVILQFKINSHPLQLLELKMLKSAKMLLFGLIILFFLQESQESRNHSIKLRQLWTANQEKLDKIEIKTQAILDKIQTENQEKWATKQMNTQDILDKMQNETLGKLERMEHQLAAIQETLIAVKTTEEAKKVPPGFEQIGGRYFYIENTFKLNWYNAEKSCQWMGGYLAAFKNQEEFDAIKLKLKHKYNPYWLGLTDVDKYNEYLSVASGKKAQFLHIEDTTPHQYHHVYLRSGMMYTNNAELELYFICQADNEV